MLLDIFNKWPIDQPLQLIKVIHQLKLSMTCAITRKIGHGEVGKIGFCLYNLCKAFPRRGCVAYSMFI
jgi:hypothetical protein